MLQEPSPFDEKLVLPQIADLLRQLDAVNRIVHPDWQNQGYPYPRAMLAAKAACQDALGAWQWWAVGAPQPERAKSTLVDVWMVSLVWELSYSPTDSGLLALADLETRRLGAALSQMPRADVGNSGEAMQRQLDELVTVGDIASFNHDAFVRLMAHLDMGVEQLVFRFAGKLALLRVRFRFGWARGRYAPTWGEQSDEEWLSRVLQSLAKGDPARRQGHVVEAMLETLYRRTVLERAGRPPLG